MQDPQLQSLAALLKSTVMKSRAVSTTRKYVRAFQSWSGLAPRKKYKIKACHFALYLQYLAIQSKSRAMVEEATNAASWVHQLAVMDPVSHEPLIKTILAGLQRDLAKPRKKKELITLVILKQMVDSDGPNRSLMDSRLLAICLLAFSAFLRFDEIVKICCCNILFKHDYMVVKVVSSKTDQYCQGDEVMVARMSSDICPVGRLEQYCQLAGISAVSTERLFWAISNTKHGEFLRKSGSLSYTRVRELFLHKLQYLGHDPLAYGTHSLRAGGVTLAVNSGVPDRMFKRHGQWKDGYVKDILEDRLSVSKSLQLYPCSR